MLQVLETFLEANLCKLFQLFHHILHDASSITKQSNADFSSGNRYKSAGARYWGSSSVVTLFFAKKSLTKTGVGVLS